jgi:acyl-CoA thioester hydrolase
VLEILLLDAFSLEKRVEFCETDAAGIAHFSSLAVYMEQAEHALFRSLGLSVFPHGHLAKPDNYKMELDVTWPRVHVRLDFLGPARFEEILKIEVVVAKLGDSSVTFEHNIHGPKHPVARGTSISVCCKIDRSDSHELIKQPIPLLIRDKLKAFLRT